MTGLDTGSFAAMEKTGWAQNEIASNYAQGFALAAEQCVPALISAVEAGSSGMAILDLCSGHGIVAEGLVKAGATVTGLDFSPVMNALAAARVPTASFVEGDATALPFETGSFDAVTMGFGMLHVPDGQTALKEARRVLRPGGRFAYSIWHPPTIPSAMAYVFGSVAKFGSPEVVLPAGPGLFDYADPEIADPQLAEAGFRNVTRTVVPCTWQADRPDLPFDYFRDGTVRGGALLGLQPEENAAQIRASVAEMVKEAHGETGPWEIPLPALVVSATAA